MSISITNTIKGPLVLVTQQSGVTVIPQPTPLTRLNYFDGKFLRASDLSAEQLYLRRLVDLSNQAGGPGVAHGYDLSLGTGGDTLNVGPGLAIDPEGRVLLLPQAFSIGVQELIERSRQLQSTPAAASINNGSFADCTVVAEAPPGGVVQAGNLYLITIGFAEALCGEEGVFGKLCEEACATSTDRPFLVEGVVLRAIPLQLQTPLPISAAVALSQLHLRSRVASSYFEDERKKVASFISGDGLRSDVWCFGAEAAGGFDVPIGVISRAGNTTLFLDAWIARRERIDTPAKRYWQWRMAMRPSHVFLAQILQFQCQLSGLFKQQPPADGGDDDPCASTRTLIREASDTVAKIADFYETVTTRFTLRPLLVSDNASAAQPPVLEGGLATLLDFQKRLQAVSAAALIPSDKFLIDRGILELSSAGYLPVTPVSVISINEQVRRLLGKGLDLQFCVVRPDFVAHALEEAQHMERISLLQGLDAPNNKPEVDILVPDGQIIEQKRLSPGLGFEASVAVNSALLIRQDTVEPIPEPIPTRRVPVSFRGAARSEELPSGGGAIYLSAAFEPTSLFATIDTPTPSGATDTATMNAAPLEAGAQAAVNQPSAGVWISLRCERNVFALERGDTTNVNARAVVGVNQAGAAGNQRKSPRLDIELNGVSEVTEEAAFTGTGRRLKGRFRDAQLSILGPAFGDTSQRRTILVDLNATVTLTKESQIEILLEHEQNSVELSANWGNKPLEAKGLISIKSNRAEGQQQGTPLAEASLKENEDVLSAKNANHVLALQALEAVAAALGDVNFADAKAKLLFPPPPKPTDELLVRGTRDWVLFHRRRTKHCSEEKLAPPLVPSRRYQVYQVLAQNDEEARRLRSLLLAGQFPASGLAQVGIVEYGGGVATLLTPAADILKDWKIAKPGNTIMFGAIGNRESAAADGETLSRTRLDRLEDALSPISKLAPQAQDDFLGNVPSSIPALGGWMA